WIVGYTPDLVVTSWMGFDQTSEEYRLTSNSSKGVGMLLKSEMEHILPHVQTTAFDVEEAESQVASQTEKEPEWMNQVKESAKILEEQLKKGTKKVKEKTSHLLDSLKDLIPR